ncbi:MAG: serine/threonine-protein kinase [Pirellulaceae bacterium]
MPEGSDNRTVAASFSMLEACLEQHALLAPVPVPQQLVDLIPAVEQDTQRLIIGELLKADLQAGQQLQPPRRLEFYWPAMEALLPQTQISFGLLLREFEVRCSNGDTPQWPEYQQRFPALEHIIAQWIKNEHPPAPLTHTEFAGNTLIEQSEKSSLDSTELATGSRIDDFFIIQKLGKGAFAQVYLARQESMQRLVALKVTTRGSAEPQALSQLDHANIVRVYDQRRLVPSALILLYMQYLPGGTLADCIKDIRELPANQRNGRRLLESVDRRLLSANQSVPEHSSVRQYVADLTWPATVAWMGIQLAEGLSYAFSKHVLHRDVKPANILLSADGVPKLADFNVSSSLSTDKNAAHYFGGSLAYMSPEHLGASLPDDPHSVAALDERSDLYSLAILLWEMWQGARPWGRSEPTDDWQQAIKLQLAMRRAPLPAPLASESATDRVLRRVLQQMLQFDREQRPQSGRETSARLRLALHPELAERFEPAYESLTGRLSRAHLVIVAALIIFVPNIAASVFNYFYNWSRMKELAPSIPQIESDFVWLANWVNGIVFPLGAVLFLWIMLPIRRILSSNLQQTDNAAGRLRQLWNIGNRASLIGGILWAFSGLVFASVFRSLHPEFGLDDAFHFFISLVLCGGVAWIYPYFGMTLLSVLVYYPKVISATMEDPEFRERAARLRRHCNWYLLSAAAIPLAAIGLLVFRQSLPRSYVLAGVCVTLIGLLAAHFANQKLTRALSEFDKVFGENATAK